MMHSSCMGTMTGAELKEIRESKGISVEQAASDTCLRAGFLRELEEVTSSEALSEAYQRLSFRMYARYLGIEMETTRRAVSSEPGKSRKLSIVPVTNFIRRMGRPPKPPLLDRQQRNRLLTIAKTTSTAVVVVLAVGLYSLNAKLARLNVDEKTTTLAGQLVPAEPRPQLTLFSAQVSDFPHITLEQECALVLVTGMDPVPTAHEAE